MSQNFSQRVLELTKKIPECKVTTYSGIGRALGNPKASRAVGTALRKNECPDTVPCYRVVRADGFAGKYSNGGTKEKIRRLEKDGIEVNNGKVNLKRHFHSFRKS
jgi:O-6-methylguanine DNA methyltransferase